MLLIDWMTPSSSLFRARTTNAALARGCLAASSGFKHPVAKTRSCFSLIFLKSFGQRTQEECQANIAYLIEGGVPAGTNIRPGDDGCLITRMRIKMTTIHGKRSTNPKGTDIDEFPRILILLLKNESRVSVRGLSAAHFSEDGTEGVDGNDFASN